MADTNQQLIREKHAQLDQLLPTLNADCWLVFCREGGDPATTLLTGSDVVGQTAFLCTKTGQKYAIMADFDASVVQDAGVFDEVVAYSKSNALEPLQQLLAKLQPATIALNYSQSDPLADGLTLGMYQLLRDKLGIADFESRIRSAEALLDTLRAQKTPEELRRLRQAVVITEKIFEEIAGFMRHGMSEKHVADFVKDRQRHYGVGYSFGEGANVMAGRVGMGHRPASDAPLQAGDTVVVDMGVVYEGYTSDIMHTYYLLPEGENTASAEVQHRFEAAREAVKASAAALAPGKKGHEIDAVAKEVLQRYGVTPYTHALGHQIGRTVHDGGTLLAPLTARYGQRGNVAIQAGEVYTIEPVVHGRTGVDGSPIGPEKDVVVTESGAEFLSEPQESLTLIRP